MGQSTDAIIAFGFDLGEELPEALAELMSEHEGEVDECLMDDAGVDLPEYEKVGYEVWSTAKDKSLAGIKIDLIAHCSGDYPMYFLAARGSDITARRGTPQALDALDPRLHQPFGADVIGAMQAFCARRGIEWVEPKWHIFSMWN